MPARCRPTLYCRRQAVRPSLEKRRNQSLLARHIRGQLDLPVRSFGSYANGMSRMTAFTQRLLGQVEILTSLGPKNQAKPSISGAGGVPGVHVHLDVGQLLDDPRHSPNTVLPLDQKRF